jgi:hypothetical protein
LVAPTVAHAVGCFELRSTVLTSDFGDLRLSNSPLVLRPELRSRQPQCAITHPASFAATVLEAVREALLRLSLLTYCCAENPSTKPSDALSGMAIGPNGPRVQVFFADAGEFLSDLFA